MNKKPFCSELVYLLSIIIISFSVAMLTAADFGISMIVAPAYIISQALPFLTFGQAEYVVQGVLFILMCLLMKKIKLSYFFSFITCLIYGLFLDLWRVIIPVFNPSICEPGSMQLWVRIVFFITGELLTTLSVAISFKSYLFPQVYDFFVSAVTKHYDAKLGKFKTIFDFSFLALSLILTFSIFGKLVGVNWGTIVMVVVNGALISFFSKTYDKLFYSKPLLKKFSTLFEE